MQPVQMLKNQLSIPLEHNTKVRLLTFKFLTKLQFFACVSIFEQGDIPSVKIPFKT